MPQLDKSKMKCNSPRAAPSWHSKKSVVKACSGGKERIIGFGDKSMTIKKSNPARRANFRARHNCSGKKDKMTAGYWSCKARSHPAHPRGHPCRKSHLWELTGLATPRLGALAARAQAW